MTYVCLDCCAVFYEPKAWTETHGFDTPPYEHFNGCPDCGGAYTRAHQCDCCDEVITGDYIKIGDKRYCDNCFVNYELGEEN